MPSVFHRRSALGVAVLLLAAFAPDDLQAQRLPGFGGVEVRGGVADLDDVESGVNYAFDIDFGYLFLPALRTYLRFEGFRGDFDPDVIAGGGDLDGAGLETGLRYDLLPTSIVSPYGVIAANFSNIKARDVSDQTATDLPDGVHTSFVIGVGAALRLGQQLSLTADVRRLTGDRGVERTLYALGLRFCPRGFDIYKRQARTANQRGS